MRRLASLSTTQRLLLGGAVVVGVVVVLVVILLILTSTGTDAADNQPIAFNHSIHAANAIDCQFCHYGVTKGPAAVIPSVEKCWGCHQYVATDNPEIQKIAEHWNAHEPIEWRRVNQEPSYVYFTHQSHIAAGVNCGSCHGDVANMTVAEEVVEMNMGFCLSCHRDQGENADFLTDCVTCHR
jgi:hypothetical protein